MSIIILSSSVRTGRKSDRVATYFMKFIKETGYGDPELVDLSLLDFPIFKERLKNLKDPDVNLMNFADKIKNASAIIVISPEYNGGIPASLKNVIDVLYEEWHGKPIGLVTVSSGPFGGAQVMKTLQFTLWKMGATVVPAMFAVKFVEKSYTENGDSTDPATAKITEGFLNKVLGSPRSEKKSIS